RDLVQHAWRRVPGGQQVQAQVPQPWVGGGLRDDRADARPHVDAARADGHLAGRDGDAEHAGPLAAADQRERAVLDADHVHHLAGHDPSTPRDAVVSCRQLSEEDRMLPRREFLSTSGVGLAGASVPLSAAAQTAKRGGTLTLRTWDPPHFDHILAHAYKTHVVIS